MPPTLVETYFANSNRYRQCGRSAHQVAEANRIAVVLLYVNAGTGTSKDGLNPGVDDF